MSAVRIEPREGESFDAMMRRFRKQVFIAKGHRWCKRRYGFYEKPSALRRKQEKMRRLNLRSKGLKLPIGLKELFARTGPTLAAGG